MTATTTAERPLAPAPASVWRPLHSMVFRTVWLASVASNLGSWMHLVAAGWLMSSLTTSAALVALLQSASSLPSFLLALPAGAMADVVDRRKLILVAQAAQLVVAALLGATTLSGAITPGLLLAFTLALGAAATVGLPAFSAITPELVAGDELPAAISLNAVAATATQAVGPALGGLLVAGLGAGAVFVINAVSFLAVFGAILAWRRPTRRSTLPAEHIGSAIRTGLRYTANAPEFVSVLARNASYVLAYSALPALLAVITRTQLGGGVRDYGLLLGTLGLGGVTGALVVPRARRRLASDRLVTIATANQAAVLLALSALHSVAAAAPLLFLAGVGGMGVLSSLSIAAQQVLPAWVRGRGLATYQLVFQLSYAAGAALWGTAASTLGLATTVRIAALALGLGIAAARWLPLSAVDGVDIRAAYTPEPYPDVQVDPDDGPMLVEHLYSIAASPDPKLLRALERARRREGALRWAVYEDLGSPGSWTETYVTRSFSDHQRQAERRTANDQQLVDRLAAASTDPVVTRYLLARR